MQKDSLFRLFRSLWYDRRINFAVFLGVACSAAVLTGALLVGDSMRGSLRDLTLDRLGRIDTILQGATFFSAPDGDFELEGEPKTDNPWTDSFSGILLPAAIEFDGKICPTQILAESGGGFSVDPAWNFDFQSDGMTVNRALADRLSLKVGDTVSLRLNSPQTIPPESSLGHKNDLLIRNRIRIGNIIPNEGLGRFSLRADQQAKPLLSVPLDWLQKRLGVEGKVNAVFFETKNSSEVSTPEQLDNLRQRFKPTPDDLGIVLEKENNRAYVKSRRMLFTKSQAEEIQKVLPDAKPGLLYLATSIKALKNGRVTPYSTVYAFDGCFQEIQQRAGYAEQRTYFENTAGLNNEKSIIALNQWTADDLDVQVGDKIELAWFAPANVNESRSQIFRLTIILPMDGIGANPNLVPDVKGLTDEKTIADWDPPFPFDAKRIRQKDEDYWNQYRAAPKAFVPLATGQNLWGSRFGAITTFDIENQKIDENQLASALNPPTFGLNFVPVKAQGLAASSGTTPFSVLFLSFSFFIIASALMLVLMLFRLSAEMKAKQIGIRLAVGWTARQIARQLLAEGFVVALAGSLAGTFFGILYAKVMVYGLTTWWVDAVTVPFLKLHLTALSLLLGFVSGVVMALTTIAFSLRKIDRIPIRTLLGGDFQILIKKPSQNPENKAKNKFFRKDDPKDNFVIGTMLIVIILAFLHLTNAEPSNRDIMYFLSGTSVLVAGLTLVYLFFERIKESGQAVNSLRNLADSNTARNRGRSLLFIGLVASTTFLVLSIGAFRLDPEVEINSNIGYYSDSGGFVFLGETAFPVYHDVDTAKGRAELGIQTADEKHLEEQHFDVAAFRLRDGDNAGCLNLYQTGNPRVLGVPWKHLEERMQKYYGIFRFAQPNDIRKVYEPSPWSDLGRPVSTDPDGVRRVPVVLDVNTAMYSLHLYKGLGEIYELDLGGGEKLRCEVVGLLSNSVLQGDILLGEENFRALFPESGGFRFFLFGRSVDVNTKPLDDRSQKILYDLLGDYGFQGESTSDRLRKLFAVQNTYLSTFQSLGGIGLLLGIFGLAVIQVRNVFERRRELALMQAVGFSKNRIILLLFYESLSLLFKGLGLAVFASLFALCPFLFGWTIQQTASLQSLATLFAWLVGGMVFIGALSSFLASRSVLRIPVAQELAEEHYR